MAVVAVRDTGCAPEKTADTSHMVTGNLTDFAESDQVK